MLPTVSCAHRKHSPHCTCLFFHSRSPPQQSHASPWHTTLGRTATGKKPGTEDATSAGHDYDLSDPIVVMNVPAVPPTPKWGCYARWAMQRTQRLLATTAYPTQALGVIPRPARAWNVRVPTVTSKSRAVAKMMAKSGLRCLVCSAKFEDKFKAHT